MTAGPEVPGLTSGGGRTWSSTPARHLGRRQGALEGASDASPNHGVDAVGMAPMHLLDLVGFVSGYALSLTVTTVIAVLIGFAFERSAFGRRRQIFSLPLAEGQLRWETRANIRVVLTAAVILGALHPLFATRFTAEGFGFAALTFVLLSMSWELYFYAMHRALHSRRLMPLHRLHHASRVTTPLSGFSIGFVESLGWIVGYAGIPLLLSLVMPVSLVGALGYLHYHWASNIVGHANVELMPRSVTSNASRFGMHSFTYHALHHARFVGNFALFTMALDRLMGTELPEWRPLTEGVLDGRPITRLQARPDADARGREEAPQDAEEPSAASSDVSHPG